MNKQINNRKQKLHIKPRKNRKQNKKTKNVWVRELRARGRTRRKKNFKKIIKTSLYFFMERSSGCS